MPLPHVAQTHGFVMPLAAAAAVASARFRRLVTFFHFSSVVSKLGSALRFSAARSDATLVRGIFVFYSLPQV